MMTLEKNKSKGELQEKYPADIYYGNDCYGRGTFEGGLFDIYKAIKAIVEYPFSIAIFG